MTINQKINAVLKFTSDTNGKTLEEVEQDYLKTMFFATFEQTPTEMVSVFDLIHKYEEPYKELKETNFEEFEKIMNEYIQNGIIGYNDFFQRLNVQAKNLIFQNGEDAQIFYKTIVKFYETDGEIFKERPQLLTNLKDLIVQNIRRNKAFTSAVIIYARTIGFNILEEHLNPNQWEIDTGLFTRLLNMYEKLERTGDILELNNAFRIHQKSSIIFACIFDDSGVISKSLQEKVLAPPRELITVETLEEMKETNLFNYIYNYQKTVFDDLLEEALEIELELNEEC